MVQAQAVRQLSYIQAVNEAIRQEMERDETVIVMGEDIAGGGDREDRGVRQPRSSELMGCAGLKFLAQELPNQAYPSPPSVYG